MKAHDVPHSTSALSPDYFARPAQVLARDLVGAMIVRQHEGEEKRLVKSVSRPS